MRIVVDENIPGAQAAFGHLGEVVPLPGRALASRDLVGADALIVRSVTAVNRGLLADTPVRFVGTATIGVDHVDRQYLADAGIGFASAAGCNARSVVEYVIAALLEIAVAEGIALEGKTLGIVGHGNIGSRLARVAPVLGLKVLVSDPPLERSGHPASFSHLDHILTQSDFITLHVPKVADGVDRTVGLIGHDQLPRMKSTAWLINSSRGDVVVGAALLQALMDRKIGGAVLDVWENEPGIDRTLMDFVRIATPHIAGYSYEGKMNGTTIMHDALVSHFGIEDPWRPTFHPPADPVIELSADTSAPESEEALIARAVRRSYPIMADDAHLREGLRLEEAQWRLHFDRLRREYPIRREFANYTVAATGVHPGITRKLADLGFRLERP